MSTRTCPEERFFHMAFALRRYDSEPARAGLERMYSSPNTRPAIKRRIEDALVGEYSDVIQRKAL